MDGAIKEAAVNGTPKRSRAPLTIRIGLVVLSVLLGAVALLAVVNLAANGNYNHATQSLQENIKTSRQDNVDWDKLRVRQQQTDAQFDDAGEMRALLLPQLRESIDHNSRVSDQLTKAIIEKAKSDKNNQSNSDTNADAQRTDGSESKKDTKLTDAQREKVEELLKQNAQSTQSDSDANNTGSAAKQNTDKSSSQAKPW